MQEQVRAAVRLVYPFPAERRAFHRCAIQQSPCKHSRSSIYAPRDPPDLGLCSRSPSPFGSGSRDNFPDPQSQAFAKQNKRNRPDSDRPYDNFFGNFGSHSFEPDSRTSYGDRSQGQDLPPPVFEPVSNFSRTAISESPRFSSGSSLYAPGDYPFTTNTYGSVPGPAGPSTSSRSRIPGDHERQRQFSASGHGFPSLSDLPNDPPSPVSSGDKGPNRSASLRRSSGKHWRFIGCQMERLISDVLNALQDLRHWTSSAQKLTHLAMLG